jgi:hypothetical protein
MSHQISTTSTIQQSQQQIRNLAFLAQQTLLTYSTRSATVQKCTSYAWITIVILCYIPLIPFLLLVVLIFYPLDYFSTTSYYGDILFKSILNPIGTFIYYFAIMIVNPISTCKIAWIAHTKIKPMIHDMIVLKSTKMFLIPSAMMQKWNSFPQHEQVVNILECRDIDSIKYSLKVADKNLILFVSHKWVGNQPDSIDDVIFTKVRDYVFKTGFEYIWFDYTCVPQSPPPPSPSPPPAVESNNDNTNNNEKQNMLLAIADILQRCSVKAFYINEKDKKSYKRSVWCQLEAMVLENAYRWHEHHEWTIYDKSDLYSVLPGFIDMVFSQHYRLLFVLTSDRAKLFVSILTMFMEYHDGRE